MWDIGLIELQRERIEAAAPRIAEAFRIFARTGRAEGVAVVGEIHGQILLASGQRAEASVVLAASAAVYKKLGRLEQAGEIEVLIREADG